LFDNNVVGEIPSRFIKIKTMGRNYKYKTVNVYVDTDVDIPLSEVMSNVDDDELLEEVRDRGLINDGFVSNGMPASSLYDELKINLLKEAYAKYSLEELEQKLK